MTPRWYWNRLCRMSPAEIAGRAKVAAHQWYWASQGRRRPGRKGLAAGEPKAMVRLPRDRMSAACRASPAAQRVVAAADALLAGDWPVFHTVRTDVPAEPNWFLDPVTGIEAPRRGYAFRLPYRDEKRVGNLKHVWEPSRHQATTLLAVAWWLTGNPAYAERVAAHLTSWWRENPFLEGIHWTSGIEVGLRLISWTWIRALMADWDGCAALFDRNDTFNEQVYQHQRYIAALYSRGSSANNHLIAELAGLACASAAFPWFEQSSDWQRWSHRRLLQEATRQTYPDGFNREQATDYHMFVLEMLLASSLATRLASKPMGADLNDILQRMADALAATFDATGRPPRFGDGDDGRGLLLDSPDIPPCIGLLGAAKCLIGAPPWWPQTADTMLAEIAAQICPGTVIERRTPFPVVFSGAGQAFMRAGEGTEEIWVRCDHGPLGYLSIAAHGHADALSVELRCGGVEVLVDPGTYCYHDQPEWRRYFKGTAGHNTLAVDGLDQIEYGGPFLWLAGLIPNLDRCSVGHGAAIQEWQAHHDGYRRLADPVTHHRHVTLDAEARSLTIIDWIEAKQPREVCLSFHLGPEIAASLDGSVVYMQWDTAQARSRINLPSELRWAMHCGEISPPLGWYSRGFGHREPSPTLVGRGILAPNTRLKTSIDLRLSAPERSASRRQKAWSEVPLES